MEEFDFIREHLRPLATSPVSGNLADDAALWPAATIDHDLIITCDTMVSGVHFLMDTPAEDVAHKLLAVNVSDLAGKGAVPVHYVLSLSCPPDWSRFSANWLPEFCDGLKRAQQHFGVDLIGGDTTATALVCRSASDLSPVAPVAPVVLTVTMVGKPAHEGYVARNTAQVGDWIVLTGDIGGAYLGLLLARQDLEEWLIWPPWQQRARRAYEHPDIPENLAQLVGRWATAACDVSDGWSQDLAKLTTASGVGAVIQRSALPVFPAAKRLIRWGVIREEELWAGGDDYVVLCTIAADKLAQATADFLRLQVPLHVIGRTTADRDLLLAHSATRLQKLDPQGFVHRL